MIVMKNQRLETRTDMSEYVEVYERGTDHFLGHVVDLSPEGMRVLGLRPFEISALPTMPLDLHVTGVGEGRNPIAVEAAGVWCEEETNPDLSNFYSAGFKFVSLSSTDTRRIERLIEDSAFRDWRRIPTY